MWKWQKVQEVLRQKQINCQVKNGGILMEFKVKGFRGNAVEAGIKYSERLDFGAICSDVPSVAAAVFTRNHVKAAPVIDGMAKIASNASGIRAVVVNSGNANACTGGRGMKDVERTALEAAKHLGCSGKDVLVSSTGVIGVPMPLERVCEAMPALFHGLSENGLLKVADAILTTDTIRKTAIRAFDFDGVEITVAGMAKGAGMIGPDMGPPSATMLAFIMTDAPVIQEWWQGVLEKATDATFNSIIVDGDTSTNDTVVALANGMALWDKRDCFQVSDRSFGHRLSDAVFEVCHELARKIVLDGEGATKCIDIIVEEAKSEAAAEQIARTIATSPLVKTAFFGNDPNWGRIMAAAGRAGTEIFPDRATLFIGNVKIFERGCGVGGEDTERNACDIMKNREFKVTLRLGMGDCSYKITTTDLSDSYVHINADYRT
jgi:glutamate N-acetyltransferase/amino-acid N-acetyltransferase